jgi:hypothetical protein
MSFDVAKWNKKRYLAEANIPEEDITEGKVSYDQYLDIVIDYLRKGNGAKAAAYLERMRSFITNDMSNVSSMTSEGFLSQKALDAAYNRPKPLDFTNKSDEEVLDDFTEYVDDQDYWTSIMADFTDPKYDAKAESIKTYRKELDKRGLGDTAREIEDTARRKYLF